MDLGCPSLLVSSDRRLRRHAATTASNILNSNRILDKSDETRGNITVEEDDLLVSERFSDRKTHALHRA